MNSLISDIVKRVCDGCGKEFDDDKNYFLIIDVEPLDSDKESEQTRFHKECVQII